MKDRRIIPWTVLALSLLATAGATAFAWRSNHSREVSRFENAVESSAEAIGNRLEIYMNMLRSGSGLFAADPNVSREEFHAYVDQLDLQTRYPGIQGIGFSAHFAREESAEVIARMTEAGFTDFRLWPGTERPWLDAILYLEPLDERNRAAIGYNMASEPTRREAMWRARDTGAPAASGLVTLVQEIDEEKQAGFLIYVPVYESTQPPATVAERRQQMRGYVYSPFRADDLFEGIFGDVRQPRVDFAIYDQKVSPDRLLHDSGAESRDPGYDPRYTTTRSLRVGGREWILRFSTRPEFDASSSRGPVWILLFGGLLFSGALFWMSLRQAHARADAVALYREAEKHRHAAEEANRTKDDFLATVSHELRTPMTSILGWSSMLADGSLAPDETRQAVDAIHRSSRVQAELIDDLLDLSRISSGKLDVKPVSADVNDIMHNAVDSVRHSASEKGLDLHFAPSHEPALVWGDPRRLTQVALNLLSNAVKFTEEGEIRAAVINSDDEVVMELSDTGVGLEPDFIPQLFQRFRQAGGGDGRKYGGLGIGLSIVRHLVELHGGRVEAQSEGPGRGATFRAILPALSGPAEVIDDAPAEVVSISGLKVLVVEDEPTVREFVSAVLGHAGAEVRQAENAADAMLELTSVRFDFLVSDISMPGEDGCSMIGRIRKLPDRKIASLPAIAITAHGGQTERERILEAGFDAIIQKPVEASQLIARIGALLRR